MKVDLIRKSQMHFLLSFAFLIFGGSLLLLAPWVGFKGHLQFIDALFMSTSAVCVTGLASVDLSRFDLVGQLSLLLLVQLGGIGIMSLTSTMYMLFKGKGDLDFSRRLMMSNVSSALTFREVDKVLKSIIIFTFSAELLGFMLLWPAFMMDGRFSIPYSAYLAVFHSISAFCNAGFSIFDDNLMRCNLFVKTVISLLIISGGIGYYVVFDFYSKLKHERKKLRVHTRLVVFVSFCLIFIGAFMIWLGEYGEISFFDAYFQSVSARTAGFNTVDITKLNTVTFLMLIFLMLIGASPGSTGGGMKTTTFALAFFAVANIFKGNDKVFMFGRHIPESNVLKAFSITILYVLIAIVGTCLMLALEPAFELRDSALEVVSALGTVGLSSGLSMKADEAGKIILIMCMYIGRVGPTALLIFFMARQKQSKISYPEEELILG